MGLYSRTIALLARGGRRGVTAALTIDRAVLWGPGPLWRERRMRRSRALGPDARTGVYRRIWSAAAERAGAELDDLGGGFFVLRRGAAEVRVFHQLTPVDDPVALRVALDKPRVHALLTGAAVPVPEHVAFDARDLGPAVDFVARVGTAVVKPAHGTAGGEGVTGGIRDAADLARARLVAMRFGNGLLAERQAVGVLHRLLLLDGELLDTVTNLPPRVVGNGHSTVEELVAAENERRLAARGDAGLELLELDLDMALALRAAGHTLATVPAAGEVVPIKSVSNDLRLEDAATYRGAVHPDVVEQARRAASIVGLRLAGVDIMAPSVDRPLAETGGVVLEVNGAPGFHRHYHVADRDGATPVADRLVEHLLGGDRHERPDGDQLPGGR